MEHGLVGSPIVSSIGNCSVMGPHCCALQLPVELGHNRALSTTPHGLHKGYTSSSAATGASANAKTSCHGVRNPVRRHLQLSQSVAGSHTNFRYCAPSMGNGIPIGPRMPWEKVDQQNCVVSSRLALRLHQGNQNRSHRRHRLVPNISTPPSSEAETRVSEEMVGDSETSSLSVADEIGFTGVHHVGVLCENLERSLDFYIGVLGLQVNDDRPAGKLPYRGSWLWVGEGMIHLMELPNPDPKTGRPEHGGRDRHACISISDITPLKEALDKAGIPYTMSKSGRPALFTRDPDANTWEFVQLP
eukprot:TRINITY_DN7896_c0_g1_i1.p1 TRINITY_DN7896_c0_g1~~TRINITY_DN7896_c0_g1_i1.p1  ORF type:complete len:302 (+),score=25.13 TRINITY_DN7896_c0_g1_i1:563-1468(+)